MLKPVFVDDLKLNIQQWVIDGGVVVHQVKGSNIYTMCGLRADHFYCGELGVGKYNRECGNCKRVLEKHNKERGISMEMVIISPSFNREYPWELKETNEYTTQFWLDDNDFWKAIENREIAFSAGCTLDFDVGSEERIDIESLNYLQVIEKVYRLITKDGIIIYMI